MITAAKVYIFFNITKLFEQYFIKECGVWGHNNVY